MNREGSLTLPPTPVKRSGSQSLARQGAEVFEQDAPDFLDGGRPVLTGVEAVDDEFGDGVIHVRARVGDQAILALPISDQW
jgi:hypothetical protein